jgi:hypothetical protein
VGNRVGLDVKSIRVCVVQKKKKLGLETRDSFLGLDFFLFLVYVVLFFLGLDCNTNKHEINNETHYFKIIFNYAKVLYDE